MSTKTKSGQVYVRVGHRYVKTIGGTGGGARKGFECPVDVAWDSKGRLHVVNRSAIVLVRVTICGLDDEFIGEYALPDSEYAPPGTTEVGKLILPGAIAIDRSDTVYISDQHTHSINLFDSEGKFIGKWGTLGNADGELKDPWGLAFDFEENLYVADTGNNRVQKFTKDGTFIHKWGSKGAAEGQFDMPWGIALDLENNVYVADWGNDRVQKFSPDGTFLMTFGTPGDGDGELRRPSGVAVDRGGDVYVADWANDRVQVFDPRGTYQLKFTDDGTLSAWGLERLMESPEFLRERHLATLEAERRFWRPSSVKIDSEDRFFVVDTNRHRLHVYKKESVAVDAEWIDLDNPNREF